MPENVQHRFDMLLFITELTSCGMIGIAGNRANVSTSFEDIDRGLVVAVHDGSCTPR